MSLMLFSSLDTQYSLSVLSSTHNQLDIHCHLSSYTSNSFHHFPPAPKEPKKESKQKIKPKPLKSGKDSLILQSKTVWDCVTQRATQKES